MGRALYNQTTHLSISGSEPASTQSSLSCELWWCAHGGAAHDARVSAGGQRRASSGREGPHRVLAAAGAPWPAAGAAAPSMLSPSSERRRSIRLPPRLLIRLVWLLSWSQSAPRFAHARLKVRYHPRECVATDDQVGQIDAACHGEFVVEIRTAADPARRMFYYGSLGMSLFA